MLRGSFSSGHGVPFHVAATTEVASPPRTAARAAGPQALPGGDEIGQVISTCNLSTHLTDVLPRKPAASEKAKATRSAIARHPPRVLLRNATDVTFVVKNNLTRRMADHLLSSIAETFKFLDAVDFSGLHGFDSRWLRHKDQRRLTQHC